MDRLRFSSLDEVLAALPQLETASHPQDGNAARIAEALAHCAESIELSVRGYPRPKSRLFQRTVGRLAFLRFARQGFMTHDLAAPIPGAPPTERTTTDAAARRLREAVSRFRAASELKPHFAYGELTREEYERAHAMHIADHLSALRS